MADNVAMLHTEQRNFNTMDIDLLSTEDMLRRINELDREVPLCVEKAIPAIARAVELVTEHLRKGGRLVYTGAGTSARVGIMDAAECPPTYGVLPDTVTCVMAGGRNAMFSANEVLEDSCEAAVNDLKSFGLNSKDIVLAISSSGRTPYCVGSLIYAAQLEAGRIALCCNPGTRLSEFAQVSIEVDTGAEAVMGSTRMKGGTAQKLVLNMISTSAMIRLGNVYSNLMINVQGSNTKLADRVIRIFMEATGTKSFEYAVKILKQAGGDLKLAVVMELAGADADRAAALLAQAGGYVRRAIELK